MGAHRPRSASDRTGHQAIAAPRPRSAPASWGEWPPSARRVSLVTERAARRLAQLLATREKDGPGLVLLVVPHEPEELDLFYAPTTEYATVGRVLAIGRAQAWIVYWNPATDAGLVRRTFDHKV